MILEKLEPRILFTAQSSWLQPPEKQLSPNWMAEHAIEIQASHAHLLSASENALVR